MSTNTHMAGEPTSDESRLHQLRQWETQIGDMARTASRRTREVLAQRAALLRWAIKVAAIQTGRATHEMTCRTLIGPGERALIDKARAAADRVHPENTAYTVDWVPSRERAIVAELLTELADALEAAAEKFPD